MINGGPATMEEGRAEGLLLQGLSNNGKGEVCSMMVGLKNQVQDKTDEENDFLLYFQE